MSSGLDVGRCTEELSDLAATQRVKSACEFSLQSFREYLP